MAAPSVPTDYGVGDIDGKGYTGFSSERERQDGRRASGKKGDNGRGWNIPWKLAAVVAVAYYFFSRR